MNSNRHGFQERGGARLPASHAFVRAACLLLSSFIVLHSTFVCSAALFTNNACVILNDTTNGLSWNPNLQKLTISCWFKLSVPSGQSIPDDMTILVNQQAFSPGSPYAYLVRFRLASGNIEFVARGASDSFTNNLIEKPYLERWYHIAVVRQNDSFIGYVDGRQVFLTAKVIGNSASASNGLSIGGFRSINAGAALEAVPNNPSPKP